MKRFFDLLLSLLLALVAAIPVCILALLVKSTSRGPVLYWSDRVGVDNGIFRMPKFRTMRINTPEVATHLMTDLNRHLTPIGRILRTTSLDELPQLWSVIRGDMSFVGPRPALFNQDDLVELRTAKGIHRLVPGITGWAQINGRDDLSIPAKVRYDEYYFHNQSFLFDLKILGLTILKVLKREGVSH